MLSMSSVIKHKVLNSLITMNSDYLEVFKCNLELWSWDVYIRMSTWCKVNEQLPDGSFLITGLIHNPKA